LRNYKKISALPDEEHTMSHSHHDLPVDDSRPSIPFPRKAQMLIEHWVKHNQAHMQDYCRWADTFRQNGLESAAALLETAAESTRRINHILSEAAASAALPEGSNRSKSNL
jgi:hypothetical protein